MDHERLRALSRAELLETCLEQDPGNRLLIREAAQCAFSAGNVERGLDLAELLLRLSPESVEARVQLANLQMEHGLWSEAEQHWAKLMAQGYAEDADVAYARASARYRMEQYGGAADLLGPFLTDIKDEWQGRAAALWMRSMHRAGCEEVAWNWFQTNRLMCAPFKDLIGVSSLVGLDCGDIEAARVLARGALEGNPNHLEAVVSAGSVHLLDGDIEQCRILLRGAISRVDEPRAWMTLGLAELADLRFADARRCLERVLATTESVSSLKALGWVHLFEGAPELARKVFLRTLQLIPGDAEALAALNQANWLREQKQSVRIDLQSAQMVRELVRNAIIKR